MCTRNPKTCVQLVLIDMNMLDSVPENTFSDGQHYFVLQECIAESAVFLIPYTLVEKKTIKINIILAPFRLTSLF